MRSTDPPAILPTQSLGSRRQLECDFAGIRTVCFTGMQFRVVAYAELKSRAVYEKAERHCSKLQSSSSKPKPPGV